MARPERPCVECHGDGWVEVQAPPGGLVGSAQEQGWMVKCATCAGTGSADADPIAATSRVERIPADAPAMTDAELTAMWRRHGWERRGDGYLYATDDRGDHGEVRAGQRAPLQPPTIPEHALPPLPDGTRP